MKRLLATVLCALLCVTVGLSVAAAPANLSVFYLQCDERWADIPVGDLTVAQSACSIASICNAVYYLNGVSLDLPALASWAHEAGLLNAPGVPGAYRSVFARAGARFGGEYGFAASEFRSGHITDRQLRDHLQSGQTAVLHVPGHFIAAVGYDAQSEQYLIIDPLPGDIGRYDRRRKGLTHTGGDWLGETAFADGMLACDGYVLFTRVLSDGERASVVPMAITASLVGLGL